MQEEWQLIFFCLSQRFAQGVTLSECPMSYAKAPEADPEHAWLWNFGGALEKIGGAVGQESRKKESCRGRL